MLTRRKSRPFFAICDISTASRADLLEKLKLLAILGIVKASRLARSFYIIYPCGESSCLHVMTVTKRFKISFLAGFLRRKKSSYGLF